MQNLLLDCKKIFVTFKISLHTLIMLVGAESIEIVVELSLLPFNIFYLYAVQLVLLTKLSSSVNV